MNAPIALHWADAALLVSRIFYLLCAGIALYILVPLIWKRHK